jgi:hypothetical protein
MLVSSTQPHCKARPFGGPMADADQAIPYQTCCIISCAENQVVPLMKAFKEAVDRHPASYIHHRHLYVKFAYLLV